MINGVLLYLYGEGRRLHAQVSSSLFLQEKKKPLKMKRKMLKEEARNLVMAQRSSREVDDKQEEEIRKRSLFC